MKKTVVLRPVNKANNAKKRGRREVLTLRHSEKLCEPQVNTSEQLRVKEDIDKLLTGLDPEINRLVHRHLNDPAPETRRLCDAWTKLGHQDRKREPRLQLKDAVKRTLTPVGIACLVSYARGWLDEDSFHATQRRD